jgi:hypothetical protein
MGAMVSIPLRAGRAEVADAATGGWGRVLGCAAVLWSGAMFGGAVIVDSVGMADWGAVIGAGAILGLAWRLTVRALSWQDAAGSLFGWVALAALGTLLGVGMGLAADALVVGAAMAP